MLKDTKETINLILKVNRYCMKKKYCKISVLPWAERFWIYHEIYIIIISNMLKGTTGIN